MFFAIILDVLFNYVGLKTIRPAAWSTISCRHCFLCVTEIPYVTLLLCLRTSQRTKLCDRKLTIAQKTPKRRARSNGS